MDTKTGQGPGVDPIPVPNRHPAAATEKLEDLVGAIMNEGTEASAGEDGRQRETRK